MLLKKQGFPKENELVLCTVTAIHFHSVFVELDEYKRQGMVHISEISPGRVRNIRDFVKEGKKIVCKVLSVNTEKGHIDLSLRRVNEMQRKEKVSELKQEQLAENIIEFIAKQSKKDIKNLYSEISSKILEKYDSVFEAFEDVALGGASLSKLGIDASISSQLEEVIKQRIKPSEVEINGEFRISSYKPDGIEIIKEAVKKAGSRVSIKYSGAGTYSVNVKSDDYKDAEKSLKGFVDSIKSFMESHNSKAEFVRHEK